MVLALQSVVVRLCINEFGAIIVSTVLAGLDVDDKEAIRSIPEQHVIIPGQDFSDERLEVRQLAAFIHTDAVIRRYARLFLDAVPGSG